MTDDASMVSAMVKNGMSLDDICHRFRHRYRKEEVIALMPKPKRKRRTKAEMAAARAEKAEVANESGNNL